LPRSEHEFSTTHCYYTERMHRTLSHFVELPEASLLHLQATSKLAYRERTKVPETFGRHFSQDVCTAI
jgi:hypothetical protein